MNTNSHPPTSSILLPFHVLRLRKTSPDAGSASKARGVGLLLAVAMLGVITPSLNAQTIWRGTGATGGNGDWGTGADWSAGVPTTLVDARFQVDGTYTSTSAVITLSGAQAAKSLFFALGKTTAVNLADTASLTASGTSTFGTNSYGSGTSASITTFAGPATGSATVSLPRFDVLRGSSLTFTGSTLSATSSGDTSIGRGAATTGAGNSMSILSGADLSFISSSGLSIGRDGGNNNTVLVSGAGSTLSARSVNVGGAGANSGNSLKVQNGGVVTATLASGAGSLATGTGSNSNYYEVTGTNSQMTIEGDFNLGDTAGTANTGGNFLRVASGGTAKFDTTLNINSYNSSGTNYGSNYVKVDAAGTFTSDSTINVKDKGLLQLAATGAIEGRNPAGVAATATIAVASGGRFEAAGSGLGAVGTTVLTTLSSNSTFAVGLGDAVAASTLTLSNTNSKVTLNTGSTFEFGIFGAATSDQLNFSATNILTVGTGVNLRLTLQGYVPVDGDSWTMITGSDGFATGSAANLAAATFVTPSLSGGLSWDTSEFNQTDGWVISVVPEPATVVLLGLSLSALLLVRRRKI